MTELAVDLFKFVALRAPGETPTGPPSLRDPRVPIVEHYPRPDATSDAEEFAKSPAAKLVHQRVAEQAAAVATKTPEELPKAVQDANRAIAAQFASEKPTTGEAVVARMTALVTHLGEPRVRGAFADLDAVVAAASTALGSLSPATTLDAYFAAGDEAPSPAIVDREAAFDALYRAYVAKQVRPLNLEGAIAAIRVLHALGGVRAGTHATDPGVTGLPTISTLDGFRATFDAVPLIHPMLSLLVGYYQPFTTIQPVGIGDLLVVKQFLRAYEPGEVAHVENVLKGENKSRTHRVLDRSEDTFTTETERTEETVRELQTTERFELKSETESTIQNDLSVEMSGQVSGRYGVVEVSASSGFSYSQSRQESRRSSNNFAKDVIDRSLSRIQTKVREERVSKVTHEVEETNVHQLDNRGQPDHITGVYRWVDKRYTAQVYNYGKRLMFEFVLPEPAAFVIAAFERSKNLGPLPKKPQPPAKPNLIISEITQATVDTYAALFTLGDLQPEPLDTKSDAKGITGGAGDQKATSAREQLSIPEGYAVSTATISGEFIGVNRPTERSDWGVFVSLGGQTHPTETPADLITTATEFRKGIGPKDLDFTGAPLVGSPTITVLGFRVESFEVSVGLTLKLTDEARRKWQIAAYNAIMDAYAAELNRYHSERTEYEDRLEGYDVGRGVVIRGRNPRINQEIIRTELKKGCLAMAAHQFDADAEDDVVFDAMRSRTEKIDATTVERTETTTEKITPTSGGGSVKVTTTTLTDQVSTKPADVDIPAIKVDQAVDEGQVVQFLEQAFEWQQMSYVLYPYFWGRLPEKWFDAQRYYDEADPLFARFLQSGSVRVLVAARPAFETAVMHYLRTRQPWNGGPTPGIDDELYVAVHRELRDQQDDLNGAEPYGDPWEVVVPTSLVWLQSDATLPTFPLPDTGEEGTPGGTARAGALWTGTAHQGTRSTLPSAQTAWTNWPEAATWQVPIPEWATEVDVDFALNPAVVDGPVWGELRLTIGDATTDPAMFDVNYTPDVDHSPEQAVMLLGDAHAIAPALRGTTVTVTMQGRMLDPAKHAGRLEAYRGCHVNGQLHFKR